MADALKIDWDRIQVFRIPEWQEHWKKAGGRFAYIGPAEYECLPDYRHALEAAIANGTAMAIPKHG